MLPQHSIREPNQVVIRAAGPLLATLIGLGASFAAWFLLRQSNAQTAAHAAVITLGVGVAAVGLSSERPSARLFWIVLAGTLVIGYLLGAPEFSRLTS